MRKVKPVYEWVWKRANKKHFLVLLRDGKRVATIKDTMWFPSCSCGPNHNCAFDVTLAEKAEQKPYVAFIGGMYLGNYRSASDAKRRVHRYLEAKAS